MPFLKRKGKPSLHYRIDDFTDPWKNAPTVLLQHGFGRSSQFWTSWVPYLSRFYKVVRPDLRGLGLSPVEFNPATDITIENYIDDMTALLDALKLESVHYCGESFGGILGMVLAAGRGVTLLGIPPLFEANKQLGGFLHEAHETIFVVTLAVVAIHVIGALWHQYVRHDSTLGRMVPWLRGK